jgi:hypothetical protein
MRKKMSKINQTLFLSILFLFSIQIQAGQETGNGGDAVICTDREGNITATLLDLYEMENNHGLKGHFSSHPDFVMRADTQVNKLYGWINDDKERDGNYHEIPTYYGKRVLKFMDRVLFVNEELQDIPDSYHTFIPRNCSIKQLAINTRNGIIKINKKIWNLLDKNNKAGLIIHELIYEDLVNSGHTNSMITRQLNAFIHGNSKKIFKQNSYGEMVASTKVVTELLLKDVPSEGVKERIELFKMTPFYAVKEYLLPGILYNVSNQDQFLVLNFFLDELNRNKNDKNKRIILNHLLGLVKSENFDVTILNSDFKPLRDYLFRSIESVENKEVWQRNIEILSYLKIFDYEYKVFVKLFIEEKNKWDFDHSTFYRIFIKLPNVENTLFDEVYKNIQTGGSNPYYYHALNFIKEYVKKYNFLRDDILDQLEKFIYVHELDHFMVEMEILWRIPIRRAFVVDNLNKFFGGEFLGSRNLHTVLSYVDHNFIDRDEWMNKLESGLSNLFLNFHDYSFVQWYFMNFYYDYGRLPRNLALSLIEGLKTDNILGRRRDDSASGYQSNVYKVLQVLVVEENLTEETIDYLGYILRYQAEEYSTTYESGYRRILKEIRGIKKYTVYLNSAISIEIKRNLSNVRLVKGLLSTLMGRELTIDQVELLEYISLSHSDLEVRKLAKDVLVSKN